MVGTFIAGGLGLYLVIEPPSDVPTLARMLAALTAAVMAYFLGIVAYTRRTDREWLAQREAEEAERLRFHQDRIIEIEAALAALVAVAQGGARERQDQQEAQSQMISLLQSINKKLDHTTGRRGQRAPGRSERRLRARSVPSITDEFRAYLAGRESIGDGGEPDI